MFNIQPFENHAKLIGVYKFSNFIELDLTRIELSCSHVIGIQKY